MRRLAITVRGVVQGVGFRPFVYKRGPARRLAGWVRNEADTVRIEVQGDGAALDAFLDALRHAPPPQARIDAIEVQEQVRRQTADQPNGGPFQIRASAGRDGAAADDSRRSGHLPRVPGGNPRPGQRRYRYPFTNCTNCGPRWSIIEQLPYDRPRTSMAGFAMCAACQAEYDDPADRRFHAQPIACPRCGPTLQLLDRQGRRDGRGPRRRWRRRGGRAGRPHRGHEGLGRVSTARRRHQCRGGRPAAPSESAGPIGRLP